MPQVFHCLLYMFHIIHRIISAVFRRADALKKLDIIKVP